MVVLPRRPHRKSRTGCIECKRRHIKCDESRPSCGNCTISVRRCSYEGLISKAHSVLQPSHRGATRQDEKADSTQTATADLSPESLPANIFHFELFHHFTTEILVFFGFDKLPLANSMNEGMAFFLGAPYLLNQVLEFAALHLSITQPERRQWYRHHASQLQTHSLSLFNKGPLEINSTTCIPMFLYTSILALHMLCKRLVFRPREFGIFLDQFIESLRLYRGVRAITNQSWHLLLESPLRIILESEGRPLGHTDRGNECVELVSLLDNAPFDDKSVGSTYRQAAESLQMAIDASRNSSFSPSTIAPIIYWSVIVSLRYIDLLSERRPEALIILAHFAGLLHIHRDIWTFGDGGEYIIRSVNSYLGSSWDPWLHWPNESIRNISNDN